VGFLADQGDRADMASRTQGFGRATYRLPGPNDRDACLRQVHRVRSLAVGQAGRCRDAFKRRLDSKLETINPVCKVKTADRAVGA
jgi:hypothetical protein